jgi:hypothetical protein
MGRGRHSGHEQTTRASEFLAREYVLYYIRFKRRSGKEGNEVSIVE